MSLLIRMNFLENFVDQDDKPTDKPLAKYLADFLNTETSGDGMKLGGWAKQLNSGGILELDRSDYDTLSKLIKETTRWAAILKYQVGIIMMDSKDKPTIPATREDVSNGVVKPAKAKSNT